MAETAQMPSCVCIYALSPKWGTVRVFAHPECRDHREAHVCPGHERGGCQGRFVLVAPVGVAAELLTEARAAA